jgi:hypothetical protein
VAAVDCETCAAQVGQAPMYNISKSSSAYLLGSTQSFSIGNGTMTGPLILENCSLRKVKPTKWAYDNQTILMVNSTAGVLANGASGFVGWGRSTGNDSYLSGIINSQGWRNATFGFAFNPFNSSAAANATALQPAGSISVRQVNPALYTGEIYWQPLVQATGVPQNMPTDWSIKFDSYKIKFGSKLTNNPGGVAIIEPYFQELRIPRDEAIEFFDNITGAKMTNDSSSLSWDVPCDQEVTLSVTIGDSTYRMKKEQLLRLDSTGTVCTSLVKGWSDPVVRAYVFGAPFASTAFIAYNAHQDQSSDQIGLAPRPVETTIIVNEGVPKTVLIAAITGSTLFTALMVSVIVFVFYHRRRGHDDKPSVKEKDKIEPFTGGAAPNSASFSVPNSATPILSTATKQNSWVIEQGPIGGEPNEGTVSAQGHVGSPVHPQSSDRKRVLRLSSHIPERQSQLTDTSVDSPNLENILYQESHDVVPPLVSSPLDRPYHSLYGARIPSVPNVPTPRRDSWPATPDERAPPPYPTG